MVNMFVPYSGGLRNLYYLILCICSTLALLLLARDGHASPQKPAQEISAPKQSASPAITKVFTPDMIGVDRAYLEQFTGIARITDTFFHTASYRVDGCDIKVYFGGPSGGAVVAFAMDVDEHCTFDLAPFIQKQKPVQVNRLTFGDFDQVIGYYTQYYADCLGLCGNAYDPSVYSHYSGPHALGFLEVMVSSTGSYKGMFAWQEIMQAQKGDEWIIEQRYNCEPQSFTNEAKKLFAHDPIERIEIGYDLLDHHALGRNCGALAQSDAQKLAEEEAELEAIFSPDYIVIGHLSVNANDGYANLRSGPGTKHPVLCELPNGSALELIRREGNWYYVALADNLLETGYVHKSQVVVSD